MKLLRAPFVATLLAFSLSGAVAKAQDSTDVVKDFQDRVKKYASLKSEQGVQPKQANSAEQIAEQKQQAVEKIHEARPVAKQGDIFTPEIAAYFKKQIESTLRGPGGDKVRASLRRAEPLPDLHLAVNAPYPKNLPLQSTPATLLLNLPKLPKGVQYRVVGSTLVLYDEATRLIIDLIPGAIA